MCVKRKPLADAHQMRPHWARDAGCKTSCQCIVLLLLGGKPCFLLRIHLDLSQLTFICLLPLVLLPQLLVAALFLLLTAPLLLITTWLIRRDSEGPIFFRQVRIGLDGRPFEMLKFRTMYAGDCRDAVAPETEQDPRVTRVGRWLRRYSLDELPNFINVLRGEMSVVGPRPEMPFIVEEYSPQDRERLRAKPGVTGLWQISYARTMAIHDNLDYDLYYIENQSFLLDLVIVALTGVAVFKGTGAY